MSAREEILSRIGTALADVRGLADEPVPRRYARTRELDDPVELFLERVADYRADVHRCTLTKVPGIVAAAIGERARLVVPAGFPADLLPDGVEQVRDEDSGPLAAATLDSLDAIVTTCAVAIAVTGTIVLDHGPGQGRRALTLVPDRHVCLVRAEQIVGDVPAAIARLDGAPVQTWISGPSATSDIELHRVEGVHGPRLLHVIVIDE